MPRQKEVPARRQKRQAAAGWLQTTSPLERSETNEHRDYVPFAAFQMPHEQRRLY
jgi:hypothetical protein